MNKDFRHQIYRDGSAITKRYLYKAEKDGAFRRIIRLPVELIGTASERDRSCWQLVETQRFN